MTTNEQALRSARSASEQTTYLALNAENILLRDEVSRLQAKFDIAHTALGVAVDECERLTGERDRARDLAVRSGVFTRDDDEHSEPQRSPWEGVSL